MSYDADTVCETLRSPIAWAETGAFPDTRRHFQNVVRSLENQTASLAGQKPASNLQHLDMTLCASELGL